MSLRSAAKLSGKKNGHEREDASSSTLQLVATGIDLSLVGLAAWMVADTAATVMAEDGEPTDVVLQTVSAAITSTSVAVWPTLFNTTIGYDKLIKYPRLSFGFLWPIGISLIELSSVVSRPPLRGGRDAIMQRANSLNADAQAIISAAFAVGALLSGLKSAAGTHIIMYALILSLALVIPNIALPHTAIGQSIVNSVQNVALNYAIGFIITGISSDMLPGAAKEAAFHNITLV
jgi:hypothetical protein